MLKLLLFGSLLVLGNNNLSLQLSYQVPILMQKYRVPGVALGIIEEGRISSLQCFGFANKTLLTKVDTSSLFQVASLSKSITAWGVLQLVDQGEIHLDDPIENYLQRWKIPPSFYSKEKVTIRSILNHTAGLSIPAYKGYSSLAKLPSLIDSLNGIPKSHERLELLYPPGEFKYSGGGYTLLQLLIEEITEKPFAEYMEQNLFLPLKLKFTSFKYSLLNQNKICIAYNILGQPLPLLHFTELAAAGLYTNITDLSFFISYSLISPSSLLTQMVGRKENGYGLGYEVEWLRPDIPLAYHFGANPGFRAGMFILPSLNKGLVILTNSDQGTHLIEDICNIWVQQATGTTPIFYQETLKARGFMQLMNVFFSVLLGGFIIRFFKQYLKKQRFLAFEWKRVIFQSSIWFFFASLWWIGFYTAYGGRGWILSAFLPSGFNLLSSTLFGWTLFGFLRTFYPKQN